MYRSLLLLVLVSIGVCQAVPSPRGILDGVFNNLLEGLRENLTSLSLPDIDTSINTTGISANLTTANITTKDLDTYEISALRTTLLPLRLDELELKWAEFSLSGQYDLIGQLNIDALQGIVSLTGDGLISVVVRNVTLRVEGVTLFLQEGNLAIKDIGLMAVSLEESLVLLENILGENNDSIGEVVNVFLGFFLTEFINDDGNDLLLTLKPVIIEKLDEILAGIDFP